MKYNFFGDIRPWTCPQNSVKHMNYSAGWVFLSETVVAKSGLYLTVILFVMFETEQRPTRF